MKFVFIRLGIVLAIAAAILLFLPISPVYILKRPGQVDGKDVHEWLVLVRSPDEMESRLAIRAIGKLGTEGEPALDELAKLMVASPQVGIRQESAQALQKMFPASAKVVDSFGKAVNDQDQTVRMYALLGLMFLKKQAHPALPALLVAVKNPENQVKAEGFTTTLQETMLVAIGRASAETEDGLPVLMEFFNQDKSTSLRNAAMRGIAEVGPPAKGAAPGIVKILKDPKSENDLRQEAFDTLEKIGAPVPKSELVYVKPAEPKGPTGGKGGPGGGYPGKGGPGGMDKGGKGGPPPGKGGESPKGAPDSEKGDSKKG